MKNKIPILAIIALIALCLTGCNKDYSIFVSSQDLKFGLDAESQTLVINANCKWTITKNDNADWYTISPMSGRDSDSIVTVTVQAYPDGDFRGSSFVVTSRGGRISRTVFVTQNKLDFYSIVNKVFGVFSREIWVTDYYGQIIEDEYKHWEYDPYDTTQGHQMYFFENGQGIQRNRVKEYARYFPFVYEYRPESNIFHIEFQLENDSLEIYDAEVLCASDSLYRVFHEYKPNRWERADQRKIGTITPTEKAALMQKVIKRKNIGEGIYQSK